MDDRLARALGRAWADGATWDLLTRLTELPSRLTGHPGDRAAADAVIEALADAGVDAERRPFDVQRWDRGDTRIAVEVPDRDVTRSFEAVALPYCPPAEVEGTLVDVGYGRPADIERADVAGNVVTATTATPPGFDRPLHRLEKVGHAAAGGAAAFVFRNHVPGQLPPTGALAFGHEGALPGVGVSSETGAWLEEYAGEATATLSVDAGTESGTAHNVVGTLGPDTGEEVLLVAHPDAHDVAEGALDNGCGVATLVGAVRILASVEGQLDRRVRVATVSGEELGLLGSEALAASLDLDDVAAVCNVDGAGRDPHLQALTHGSPATREAALRAADRANREVGVQERPHPYSDHWPFLRAGVPALQFHSASEDAEGPWERGWTHTRADTRDKATPRTIRDHAMLVALAVLELCAADLPRVDERRLQERLEPAREGMEAAGTWPERWD